MRRLLSLLTLTFMIPLAGCFDVDLTIDFTGENSAEMTMVMVASPEFYAMYSSAGEDLCEDGEGVVEDDGSYVCTEVESGTLDEFFTDPEMSEGITLERRDNGQIYVAFDLADMTEDVGMPEDDTDPEMEAMMREAFEGHAIRIAVRGAEIVETNGTISDDGTEASFEIPLPLLLEEGADLPETFNALLVPGS